jgi:outer membrane protein TolC
MHMLLRVLSFALLSCLLLLSTAAMAQDPITKTPVPEQDLRDDPLLKAKRLPVPPPPDLTRVGVEGGELTLTLNEAIRRALENNNDIEVSRDNVRLAESTLRSFEGVYDPLISLTPQFSDARTPAANVNGATGLFGPIQADELVVDSRCYQAVQ